eukprot:7027952-Pyramimonas_sp.AAC.2
MPRDASSLTTDCKSGSTVRKGGVQDSASDRRLPATVISRNPRSFHSRVEYLAGSCTQDVCTAGLLETSATATATATAIALTAFTALHCTALSAVLNSASRGLYLEAEMLSEGVLGAACGRRGSGWKASYLRCYRAPSTRRPRRSRWRGCRASALRECARTQRASTSRRSRSRLATHACTTCSMACASVSLEAV